MATNRTSELTMSLTAPVLAAIRDFIGSHHAERGGMLGRDCDGVVRFFAPDRTAQCSGAAYDPDLEAMNRQIKVWKQRGVEFCGFAHSHPPGVRRLSSHDVWYAGEILACFKKLEALWLPIIMTEPDAGRFEIIPFAAIPSSQDRKHVSILDASAHVLDECTEVKQRSASASAVPECPTYDLSEEAPVPSETSEQPCSTKSWRYDGNFPNLWAQSPANPDHRLRRGCPQNAQMIRVTEEERQEQSNAEDRRNDFLARLSASYDLGLHDTTRLVLVGTGGAKSFARNAARMGFSEFVMIDHDVVSVSNIATQQADPKAIGHSKVDALAQDIRVINPAAAVVAIPARIESITDAEFESLLSSPLRAGSRSGNVRDDRKPSRVIFFGFTDSFWANARVHRLGLEFGLPTICAQEYVEGRGAEVTYTVPDVTPACHRCITSSRYRAYLQEGYVNDVTSEDAPVFAAEILNGILGHILLAVAYHGTDHPRWGTLIKRLGRRNLIRIRMDPDFDRQFGNAFEKRLAGANDPSAFFMFDSLFLPQSPDMGQLPNRPRCPDCGGTGDLASVKGTFHDTRVMRQYSTNSEDSKKGE